MSGGSAAAKFDVGALYMNFGVGVWQAQTWKDGSKAFPISSISSISVREKDSMLLFGHCAASTTIKPGD